MFDCRTCIRPTVFLNVVSKNGIKLDKKSMRINLYHVFVIIIIADYRVFIYIFTHKVFPRIA